MRRYIGLKMMFAGFFVVLGSCGACAAAFPSVSSGNGSGGNAGSGLMTVAGIGFYVGVGLVLLGMVAMVVEVIIEWRRGRPSKPDDPGE